jgi:ubiquinone/menaquinone biosynthesis C-methylase UbiE
MKIIDFSIDQKIIGAQHWHSDINQLYHPAGHFEQDSFDIVYSNGTLNITKFAPILLKEWFYLVKNNGYLIIDYKPNSLCNWKHLEHLMWWLWKQKYEIIYHALTNKDDSEQANSNSLIEFVKKSELMKLDKASNDIPIKSFIDSKKAQFDNQNFRFICRKISSTII